MGSNLRVVLVTGSSSGIGRAVCEALAARSIAESIEGGEDAKVVAATVLRAASEPSPKLRYPVGKGAGPLARLRSLLTAGMFDGSLRKNFHLDG